MPKVLRGSLWLAWLVGTTCAPAAVARAEDPPPPLYRVFLTDGTNVAAYGEWVRVGERVVFSVAVDERNGEPALHLVSLPAGEVDWPATERYRDGLRAAQYAATRGDEDFAALSEEVAKLLNSAAQAEDDGRKLAYAGLARQRLAEWPAAHYGYRAEEVRQVLALVDEVVSGLRAARGDTSFDLSLVASVAPPPPLRPLPPPSLRDAISHVLRLSASAESPADRVSLLRTASGVLEQRKAELPRDWVSATRDVIGRSLRREAKVDEEYAALRTRALDRAARAADRADVRGVERAIARTRETDARLGGQRPDAIHALMAALEERLDAARRLRLARDQWQAKASSFDAYRRATKRPLEDVLDTRPALEDIKAVAGPGLDRLRRVERLLASAQARLTAVVAPPDLRAAHAVALSSLQLARNAVQLRRTAVETGAMRPAMDASAAAAGALMLMDRARTDAERAMQPPQPR